MRWMWRAYSTEHALNCKRGALVTQYHKEVRDALGDIATMVYCNVLREPIVSEADPDNKKPGLIAYLGVRRLWQPQTEALLNVCVVDTNVQSYRHRSIQAVLASVEEEKK